MARGDREVTLPLVATGQPLISHSAIHTRRIGECLGRLLEHGDVICLEGNLGTGKTCLTQGIGRGLGVTSAVTSPTFVIIGEYPLPAHGRRLYHIDLYRVHTNAETRALGLTEYLYGDGICVIEWAEQAMDILPAHRLWITLRHLGDTKRKLGFHASGKRYTDLLQRFGPEARELSLAAGD